jgi:hypothetical protein
MHRSQINLPYELNSTPSRHLLGSLHINRLTLTLKRQQRLVMHRILMAIAFLIIDNLACLHHATHPFLLLNTHMSDQEG